MRIARLLLHNTTIAGAPNGAAFTPCQVGLGLGPVGSLRDLSSPAWRTNRLDADLPMSDARICRWALVRSR